MTRRGVLHIPTHWVRASAPVAGRPNVSAWGWGESHDEAASRARERAERAAGRLQRGEPFPEAYDYVERPIREEVLDRIGSESDLASHALISRNHYGALVLNTSGLMFIDIDAEIRPPGILDRLLGVFGVTHTASEQAVTDRVRDALAARGSFRLYRTAAGFRAIATDRAFDPSADATVALMQDVGADPAYVRLCRAQNCFRARLTPKHWRCDLAGPPHRFPLQDAGEQSRFDAWVQRYNAAARGRSTCHFLESIGSGQTLPEFEALIAAHDQATNIAARLPLA